MNRGFAAPPERPVDGDQHLTDRQFIEAAGMAVEMTGTAKLLAR